jgi:very-short-patch-repair endonuclease
MPIGSTNRHARTLRRQQTDAEAKLWSHLRNRRLGGFKFRRQATVGFHVADFLCPAKRLIVELDGGQHSEEADARRTARLEALGYRIIRFWNGDVLGNTDGVLQMILASAQALPSRFEVRQPSSNSGQAASCQACVSFSHQWEKEERRTFLLPFTGEG